MVRFRQAMALPPEPGPPPDVPPQAFKDAVYEGSSQAPFRHLIVFLSQARTVHAHHRPSCRRVLACSSLAFFLPRRAPVTFAAGVRRGRKNALLCGRALPRFCVANALLSAASSTDRTIRPDYRLSV